MAKKRDIEAFNLSFLDIMCCGFGATVLLVMLLHGKTLQKREHRLEDLQSSVDRLALSKEVAEEELKDAQARHAELTQMRSDFTAKIEAQIDEIEVLKMEQEKRQIEADRAMNAAQARESRVAGLNAKIKRVRQRIDRLSDQDSGDRTIGLDGDGRRQYLTGLKLGGDRTLILLDASASMLDETIINIVRRKNMNDELRRMSPKWQRVILSLQWLLANLPKDKSFQVYYFNTKASPAIPDTDGHWLDCSDKDTLSVALKHIDKIAPIGGTSLHAAFGVIQSMEPLPDSVLLLTDGLPTQGQEKPSANKVSAESRLVLFRSAVSGIQSSIPINTFLFPIEGDPAAAGAFWDLAIRT